MKKIKFLFILIAIFLSIRIYSQTAVRYFYDNAGNRIKREKIPVLLLSRPASDTVNTVLQNTQNKLPVNQNMDEKVGNVEVFPNPVQNQLSINNTEGVTGGTYVLYDAVGKLLWQQTAEITQHNVDVSRFSSGIYYLVLKTQKEVLKTWKVVKPQ
jgi:hypothetical protein